MDRCHTAFAAFVERRLAEDPGALIYGTTTAPGDGAAVPLTPEAQARRPTRLWTAHSFGEPLPARVARAIVLARLAQPRRGHAAVRGAVGQAVAGRCSPPRWAAGHPLEAATAAPARSSRWAGCSDDLASAGAEQGSRPKERMAVINGSPCAAATRADLRALGGPRSG